MARPRYADGFTRIPNELIGVFGKVNLSPYEWRVFWFIVRQTWSWRRRGFYSSYRIIAEGCGLDIGHAGRTIKKLIDKFILITRNGRTGTYFELNPEYEKWRLPEKLPLFQGLAPEASAGVASGGNGVLPEQALSVASGGSEGVACIGSAEVRAFINTLTDNIGALKKT